MKVGEKTTGRGRRTKYNWTDIFAKMKALKENQMIYFAQGDDYKCAAHSFRAMLHTVSKLRGLLLDVVVLDDGKTVGARISDRAPRVINRGAKSDAAQEKKTVKKGASKASEHGKRKATRSK